METGNIIIENDTFNRELNVSLQIPDDFSIDTVSYRNDKINYQVQVMLPRLVNAEYKDIERNLKSTIYRRIKKYLFEKGIDDINKGKRQVSIEIEPVNIYKSAQLISYGFRASYIEEGAMRHFWNYLSVNYDIGKNICLKISDYFIANSKTDSTAISYIIFSAVGETNDMYNPDWREYGFDDSFDFSVDEQKIHFYFDEFTVGGNPSGLEGAVKKKYILNRIKDEYR